MFIGHETLAFAFVALAATLSGTTKKRALALGVAAGLFALVPDADMVYALTGLLHGRGATTLTAANSFWAASTVVHRSITHSVVIAVPVALGFALLVAEQRRFRILGIGILTVLSGLIFAESGLLGVLVTSALVLAGWVVGHLSVSRLRLNSYDVGTTALVGLISHPFGDLLTGQPPTFLYPFDVVVLEARPEPFLDDTLNLLTAFSLELIAIWAGILVYLHLTNRQLRAHLAPRAAVGGAYALAVVLIQPPTLDSSYQFVFSVLAVGSIGLSPRSLLNRVQTDPVTIAVTGLTAISLAGAGYTLAYLLIGGIQIVS